MVVSTYGGFVGGGVHDGLQSMADQCCDLLHRELQRAITHKQDHAAIRLLLLHCQRGALQRSHRVADAPVEHLRDVCDVRGEPGL